MTEQQRQTIKTILRDDAGFSLIVGVLRERRTVRNMSLERLSSKTGIPIERIARIEAGDFDSAGVKDLLLISKALGYHAGVALVPKRAKPPKENEAILEAYDRLIRSRKAVKFVVRQPDKVHAGIFWDVIGNREQNFLFVVCSNAKRVRFAAVTDSPGGWPLGSQWAGMDVETRRVTQRMCARLLQRHLQELVG